MFQLLILTVCHIILHTLQMRERIMGSTSAQAKKPANKTLVYCTLNDSKCKGLIVLKTEYQLTVQMPTGCVLHMVRPQGRKLYVCYAGQLEFVSDGWATI